MTPLDGGEPSPKGLPWAGASRMSDAAREARRHWSGGREEGDRHVNPPLLSRYGRDEGTSGSPSGRRTRAGGWGVPLQFRGLLQLVPPFTIGAKNAPGSTGTLPELAVGSLWR